MSSALHEVIMALFYCQDMATLFIAVLVIIATNCLAAFPPFFRDLEKINSRYAVAHHYEGNKPKSFKQYVIESSRTGKGTLIMKADEWKLEWCKAKPFNETVRQHGCFSREMQNMYCYGQCNSIYIPGQRYLEGCSACRPKSYEWVTVTLLCPFSAKKRQHKRVQMVYSCYCFDCPK